jgi:hypothetical protein
MLALGLFYRIFDVTSNAAWSVAKTCLQCHLGHSLGATSNLVPDFEKIPKAVTYGGPHGRFKFYELAI